MRLFLTVSKRPVITRLCQTTICGTRLCDPGACQSVKLPTRNRFSVCRIPKQELIHGDMIAGNQFKKYLDSLRPFLASLMAAPKGLKLFFEQGKMMMRKQEKSKISQEVFIDCLWYNGKNCSGGEADESWRFDP